MDGRLLWVVVAGAVLGLASCSQPEYAPIGTAAEDERKPTATEPAPAATAPRPQPSDWTFRAQDGAEFPISQYLGTKHVVVVVTRGYPGFICPFCNAQSSRLLTRYADFAQREAEVVLVFPGGSGKVGELQKRLPTEQPVPFPIVLDPELRMIDALGLRGSEAKPTTYIIDKQGALQYAYVGQTPADRPPVETLLETLDRLNMTAADRGKLDASASAPLEPNSAAPAPTPASPPPPPPTGEPDR